MSDKLILVLNCGSSSVKGAVLDSTNGEVLLSCLAEKLNLPDARLIFKVNGEKHTVSLAEKPNHPGASAQSATAWCMAANVSKNPA